VDWQIFYGTVATFAPNSQIWAGEKGDTAEDLVSVLRFYGVAATQPSQ
jgi:hypothetical protein